MPGSQIRCMRNNPIPIPINIGVIQGGNWPSSVPDTVKLEGRMGVAPEEKLEDAKEEMLRWMEQLRKKTLGLKRIRLIVEWFGASGFRAALTQSTH